MTFSFSTVKVVYPNNIVDLKEENIHTDNETYVYLVSEDYSYGVNLQTNGSRRVYASIHIWDN